MTEEEIESIAKTECKKLLQSEKGYNGISFQEFWEEGAKWGYEKGYEDCRHYAHDYYKPKWHDLRKDPNDLPKLEYRDNSWSITVANQLGEACHYNYKQSRWENPLFTEIEGVIAWCELPQYKDKE